MCLGKGVTVLRKFSVTPNSEAGASERCDRGEIHRTAPRLAGGGIAKDS